MNHTDFGWIVVGIGIILIVGLTLLGIKKVDEGISEPPAAVEKRHYDEAVKNCGSGNVKEYARSIGGYALFNCIDYSKTP